METSDIKEIEVLVKKIRALDLKAESLKAQRNLLNVEAKKWADRREVLNNKSREERNELKRYKIKRDEINGTIKSLKKNRSEIINEMILKREEYSMSKEKLNNLLTKTSKSANVIENQIEKLDWKIQTNPLSPEEENEIIDKIRLLEKQKLFHNEIKKLKEKLTELKAEIGVLRIQNNEIHSKISELADKSREHHNRVIKIRETQHYIDESNDAHRKFLECEKGAHELHRKYLETIAQIRITDAKIKEIEKTTYNERQNKEAESLREAAYKKLKNGKKLTLDEFKFLKQSGLI